MYLWLTNFPNRYVTSNCNMEVLSTSKGPSSSSIGNCEKFWWIMDIVHMVIYVLFLIHEYLLISFSLVFNGMFYFPNFLYRIRWITILTNNFIVLHIWWNIFSPIPLLHSQGTKQYIIYIYTYCSYPLHGTFHRFHLHGWRYTM